MERVATDDIPAFLGGREGEGRRALITGLRGFTARYLAQELTAAGYRVYGTVMPGEELGPDIYPVDLLDRAAVAEVIERVQPDMVAHLAAIAFVAHANADMIYRVNVVGTRNLLEALAGGQHRPTSVLLASSANIYGNASVPVIDENLPPSPANDYAVSKLAMEYMARLWMDKLPITIARPFNYTGIGQAENFLLPKIVSHFRRNEKRIELGNLDAKRDWGYAREYVEGMWRILQADEPDTFVLATNRTETVRDFVSMAFKGANIDIEFSGEGENETGRCARTGKELVRVSPKFYRPAEVDLLIGDPAKAKRVLGWEPKTTLEELCQMMVDADLRRNEIGFSF